MSTGRLILNFKNGVSLALSEDKLRTGAVIEIDTEFSQTELPHKEAGWIPVDREEARGETVLKLSGVSQQATTDKRRMDAIDTEEANKKMKSVITTAEGRLVSAVPTEVQEVRRATLTSTQRRNKNRRIRKMLTKLTADQREEEIPATWAETSRKPVRREPVPREERRGREIQQERRTDPAQPRRAYTQTQRAVLAAPAPEGALMEITPEEVRRVAGREGVEPYIPQYVTRPRGLQRASEFELEKIRRMKKETFEHFEMVQGEWVNILEGLELHTDVFSRYEQRQILDCVDLLQEMGRAGRLRRRTYTEPRKWMPGKGRITIQCGCCYNFAEDREGNPPGILRDSEVDPMPLEIKNMVKRMIRWRVLPADCIPNSCIINIYEKGDCIPPHIDHHDFVRPFCTVSFINQCDILFGSDLRIVGPGKFRGPAKIPLPVGSVLILKGNGADVAKHCIPGVPFQRVSVTFRRMDASKAPYHFQPDPELESLRPYEF